MIFRQVDEILDGRKTQTRRVCKPQEVLAGGPFEVNGIHYESPLAVYIGEIGFNERLKWMVGRTYAIVPKRGQPGIGTHRIRITGVRQERVQDISAGDAIAEGIGRKPCANCYSKGTIPVLDPEGGAMRMTCPACGGELYDKYLAYWNYAELWASINTRKGARWEDNPLVWVIEFECVKLEPGA